MGARRYFGTDGIRGRVGQGVISADFVLRLGNALGRVLTERNGHRPVVVIGRTRAFRATCSKRRWKPGWLRPGPTFSCSDRCQPRRSRS